MRLLTHPTAYNSAQTSFAAPNQQSALDYLRDRSGGIRASAHMPAPVSTISLAVKYQAAVPAPNAVAAIWQGFETVFDNVTRSNEGEIIVTARALWAYKIVRSAPYSLLKFKS